MKALIVDSCKTTRAIERLILEGLGFTTIIESGTARDALSRLFAVEPHIILLGPDLADMTGLELLKQYRKRNQATPVIMVAPGKERSQIVAALASGATHYVIQPFTEAQLAGKIHSALAKAASASAH